MHMHEYSLHSFYCVRKITALAPCHTWLTTMPCPTQNIPFRHHRNLRIQDVFHTYSTVFGLHHSVFSFLGSAITVCFPHFASLISRPSAPFIILKGGSRFENGLSALCARMPLVKTYLVIQRDYWKSHPPGITS